MQAACNAGRWPLLPLILLSRMGIEKTMRWAPHRPSAVCGPSVCAVDSLRSCRPGLGLEHQVLYWGTLLTQKMQAFCAPRACTSGIDNSISVIPEGTLWAAVLPARMHALCVNVFAIVCHECAADAHLALNLAAGLAQRQDVQQSGLARPTRPQQRHALARVCIARRRVQNLHGNMIFLTAHHMHVHRGGLLFPKDCSQDRQCGGLVSSKICMLLMPGGKLKAAFSFQYHMQKCSRWCGSKGQRSTRDGGWTGNCNT